jgi:hypothetical protein
VVVGARVVDVVDVEVVDVEEVVEEVDVVDEVELVVLVDAVVVVEAELLLPLWVTTSSTIRMTRATPRPITTPRRTRLSGPRRPGGPPG